ncbi:AAA family ATPase [Hugenholtzia roseola]|uniref:AAA family ATPase n=1 Tax=Hugenholtzia roseola TaxID=1002 RepID=UPI0004027872|nr:AAA family ATPase [Hugenholtzia roseola]
MEKVIVKNFRAIKEAEIELKKITILIGEQATGKSTLAKVVHFFKTLKEELFKAALSQKELYNELNIRTFQLIARRKFYDLFGSTLHLDDFFISYHFNEESSMTLSLFPDKRLRVEFSEGMDISRLVEEAHHLKRFLIKENAVFNRYDKWQLEQEKEKHLNSLSLVLNAVFHNNQNDFLYLLPNRGATVAYAALFEKYLFESLQAAFRPNQQTAFRQKVFATDEALMLDFVRKVEIIRGIFYKYGGSFESLLQNFFTNKKDYLYILLSKINEILKGRYVLDNFGEKIFYDEEKYITLSDASLGQQEVIRLLQDFLVSVLEDSSVFRVLEKPEAGLSPNEQQQLIEALIFTANHNPDNQFLITTHSPYILHAFNNAMFAQKMAQQVAQDEASLYAIDAIVSESFWLNPNEVAVYALQSDQSPIESLINGETGLIARNYLDSTLDKLAQDFHDLNLIFQK